ncbi:MAG TPA: electron transfer flavoprotein subunit beta/FixA family protein [Thermoleophilia bacterium]|nr:electron transfer flavoprotein subunit beta/FixA family protein [Thermoleophilia bacterium]
MMLTIAVCVKQVVDPEAPLSLFAIAPDGRNLVPPPGTPPVLSAFDENALEAALRIKDAVEARVTVLSMGNKLAKPVLKKCLAAGADELILLEDERFEDLDSNSTAEVLAGAIQKLGGFDLVLCGRQAADTDAGQVGFGIAAKLDMPAITLARKVEATDTSVRVERVLPDGHEVVETAPPVLVTASNEIGEFRFPPVKSVIAAQKVQPTVWSAADLGVDFAGSTRVNLFKLFVPERDVHCEMIEGSPEEIAGGISEVLKARVR